ncbi:MAG: hypothetical protein WCI47_01675 [bacterium]
MPNDNQPPVTPTPPPFVPPTMNGVPSPPAPGAPQAPVSTPAAPIPPGVVPPIPTPPPPTPPEHKKSPLPIIIIVILILFLIGGGIWYFVTQRSKNISKITDPKNSPSTTTQVQAAIKNDCGALLVDKNKDYPDMGKSIALEDWPKGSDFHNSGDQDSVTEFCELKKLSEQAEGFLSSLGSKNFDKAYSYLSAAEVKAKAKAAKINDWTAEYGSFSFDPKTFYQNTDATNKPQYGIEPCLKSTEPGWTKKITTGYYRTPDIKISDVSSTTIHLVLVNQDGKWVIAGENNQLFDAAKVIDGDAFGTAQSQREFTNPFTCL